MEPISDALRPSLWSSLACVPAAAGMYVKGGSVAEIAEAIKGSSCTNRERTFIRLQWLFNTAQGEKLFWFDFENICQAAADSSLEVKVSASLESAKATLMVIVGPCGTLRTLAAPTLWLFLGL